MKRTLFIITMAFFSLSSFSILAIEQTDSKPIYQLKVATIAPEGSTWANIAIEALKEAERESGGRLKFLVYGGGVMGDEPDIIRKMRMGQIQGGAFTVRGISTLAPEMMVLSLPFLFNNFKEVDYIRGEMYETFRDIYNEHGFILLSWIDVGGFGQLFSKNPVRNPEDLVQQKVWVWAGEPLSLAFCKALGVTPIPLTITEVLTALQTGMINTVYANPLACVALQWYTRINYIIKSDFAYGPAVVGMVKKDWDVISSDIQELMIEKVRKYEPQLIHTARRDDDQALLGMHRRGIEVIVLTPEEKRIYREMTRVVYDTFVDKLYPRWLLEEVEKKLLLYRTSHQ